MAYELAKFGGVSLQDADAAKQLRVLSRKLKKGSRALTVVSATSATLTTTQILSGLMQTSPAGAINLTTPTAAQLVAAEGPDVKVRDYRKLTIVQTGSNSAVVTVVAGTGVTIVGTATIAIGVSASFELLVTNITATTEAVTLVRV